MHVVGSPSRFWDDAPPEHDPGAASLHALIEVQANGAPPQEANRAANEVADRELRALRAEQIVWPVVIAAVVPRSRERRATPRRRRRSTSSTASGQDPGNPDPEPAGSPALLSEFGA